jgi:hypothetical protein
MFRSPVRDDIHKKLPLPRKRQAVAFEVQQLSRALLSAVARCVEQPDLFGRLDPRLRELAASAIDHDFIRELAVTRERDANAALGAALRSAADTRVSAQLRSVRTHTALVSPKDAEPLHNRLTTVFRAVDVGQLISQTLEGRRAPAIPPPGRSRLDFEIDIRTGL